MEALEVHLNDDDFTLQAHPAHEASDLEQLNVLNDLLGRLQARIPFRQSQ